MDLGTQEAEGSVELVGFGEPDLKTRQRCLEEFSTAFDRPQTPCTVWSQPCPERKRHHMPVKLGICMVAPLQTWTMGKKWCGMKLTSTEFAFRKGKGRQEYLTWWITLNHGWKAKGTRRGLHHLYDREWYLSLRIHGLGVTAQNPFDREGIIICVFTDEVESDVNVFCARVLNRVVWETYCALIVYTDGCGVTMGDMRFI